MKLLILSDSVVYREGAQYISNDTALDFFAHQLSAHFASVTLCVPVSCKKGAKQLTYRFPADAVDIVETYAYRTVAGFYKNLPIVLCRNFWPILRATRLVDIVLLRLPAMNSFFVTLLAWIWGKPLYCYFEGDEKSVVNTRVKYKGWRLWIASTVATLHFCLYKLAVSYSKASFFLSMDLKRKFEKHNGKLYLTYTSLIEDGDIRIKESQRMGNPVRVLYVGRLSYEKGVEYLIRSMRSLGQDGYCLLLCGDGPQRARLQNLADEMSLSNSVKFFGFVSSRKELLEIYRKCDIFVIPSLSEGCPKVLFEAMASGLPVIASSVGGVSDIVRHMENGILVPPGDINAISDAIRSISEDMPVREMMVAKGYDFVRKHTAQKQAQLIADIIYRHEGMSRP
jgi:glycosyltransferase involved in cell wall biosynthesis